MTFGGDKEEIVSSLLHGYSTIKKTNNRVNVMDDDEYSESAAEYKKHRRREERQFTNKLTMKNEEKILSANKRTKRKSMEIISETEPSVYQTLLKEQYSQEKQQPSILKVLLEEQYSQKRQERQSPQKKLLQEQYSKKQEGPSISGTLLEKQYSQGKQEAPSISEKLLKEQRSQEKPKDPTISKQLLKEQHSPEKQKEPSVLQMLLKDKHSKKRQIKTFVSEKQSIEQNARTTQQNLSVLADLLKEQRTSQNLQTPVTNLFPQRETSFKDLGRHMERGSVMNRRRKLKSADVSSLATKTRIRGEIKKGPSSLYSILLGDHTETTDDSEINDMQKYPRIFTTDAAPSVTSECKTWDLCEKHYLKLLINTHPTSNAFQEMIQWTEEGKLWKFPIDNEQGMDEEHNIHFSEHVFLERHLTGWCPTKGPIRHFMELVCVGLSKNPYMTVQEKYDHIMWYRQYFEDKKDLLNELGLVDVHPSNTPKQIKGNS
ncbi:PREDICTED: uncharacterized protein DDB_G0290301 [Dufourea novaeangliae]|nr:PREDICTED: uncharacterized protein DDB_G0290301 [Dufourea novaeangliae]